MKKKLLFVLPSLRSGGAEKSLVTLLQTMDATRFEVDLLLFRREGLFLPLVPDWVRILDGGEAYRIFDGSVRNALIYFLKRRNIRMALNRLLYAGAHGDPKKSWKYLSRVLPRPNEQYDAAVGYLEGTATYFVADCVRAKKKITFLHTDYDRIVSQKSLDAPYYERMDAFVGVSEQCCEKAIAHFPFLAGKAVTMHNIVSPAVIGAMARQGDGLCRESNETMLLTVGRLSPPKGIDLAVEACALLRQRGRNIRWFHIGIGELQTQIEALIREKRLEQCFVLLGERSNPYPYVASCDIYVQPSRFEGKSIAIDEAKCLAKPIVVTDFGTVHDQIQDGVNGLIAPMSPEGIAEAVERLLDSPKICADLCANLHSEKLGNEEEIEKLYALL